MEETINTSLSINGNIWNILETNDRQTEILSQNLGISLHLAHMLNIRKINPDDIANFLEPKLSNLMPNPSILKDMDKASSRIANAIINHEKIAIIGDYDVDGATSTSVMRLFLNYLKAETAVNVIVRKLQGRPVKNRYSLPASIVERESVGTLKYEEQKT
jgi:single-stranded-DNA-specific exonuclease